MKIEPVQDVTALELLRKVFTSIIASPASRLRRMRTISSKSARPSCMASAGMELRKWRGNTITEDDRARQKVLGVTWDTTADIIHVTCGKIDKDASQPWTRRLLLCAVASLFDPLGLCNIPNFDSTHSDTFFSVLVFLQSRHKQIPKKHHINTVSTSHISHTHITFTRNAADHNITQSVLTRCHHLSQSIVRAGKMLSITILPP